MTLTSHATGGGRPSRLEAFTREILGCQCPAEVFDRVRVDKDVTVGGIPLRRRILVGNRLLIYLVDEEAVPAGPGPSLTRLCRAGASERDALGFNRFRLVVAASKPLEREPAEHEPVVPDDHCHIHRVTAEELERGCV